MSADRSTELSGMGADEHRFVFVGGVHRSGTTLLADLLSRHSQVSGLSDTGVPEDEGQHLQSLFPIALHLGGFGRFGLSAEAHLTESSPLLTDEARDHLLSAWAPYWDLSARVLLEKSPPNVLKTRFLQALFPSASFVMVLRHPIAVTYATHKILSPWSRWEIHRHLEHWLTCYETLMADAEKVRRLTVVRYEDLVDDPAGEVARVQRFLGLPPEATTEGVRSGLNDGYLGRWHAGRLNPAKRLYVAYLIRRFEDRVNRFGYSLRDTGLRPLPPPLAALTGMQPAA